MKKPLFANISILHIILIGMVCTCVMACDNSARLHAPAIADRSAVPVLDVDSVSTLISDSGITRYRISAPSWQIYDKAQPSYWLFPKGIYLEKFNMALEVEASLQANYAKYNDQEEIWILRGDVHALNERGETFETEELIWEQKAERIHSDSCITITRNESVLMGIGFESNQTMTQYTILQPTGYFPVDNN